MFEDVTKHGWIEQSGQSDLLAKLVSCSAWQPLLHPQYQQKMTDVIALHDCYNQPHASLHAGERFLFRQLSCMQLH